MEPINITIGKLPVLVLATFSMKMGWHYNKFDYMPAIVYRKENGYLYIKWLNGYTSTNIDDDNYLLKSIHENEIKLYQPINVWINKQNWFYKLLYSIISKKYHEQNR